MRFCHYVSQYAYRDPQVEGQILAIAYPCFPSRVQSPYSFEGHSSEQLE